MKLFTVRFSLASIALLAITTFELHASTLLFQTTNRISDRAAQIVVSGTSEHQDRTTNSQPFRATIEYPSGNSTELVLHSVSIFPPDARVFYVVNGIQRQLSVPDVTTLIGSDPSVPGSFAVISYDASGRTNGLIDYPTGNDWYLATLPDGSATYLSAPDIGGNLPEGVPYCGVQTETVHRLLASEQSLSLLTASGPRLSRVAIDADSLFLSIFPSSGAAASYVAQLIATISAIYERDLDVRLSLEQVRLFNGPTPFSIDDVGEFADYWENNEDTSLYDVVHLFTSSRNLPFGGIAFVSGSCQGAFGIDGFLLGSLPITLPMSGRGMWDLTVVAHEMGHNLGTFHTHDGYDPQIDSCANGGSPNLAMVGTIMSYCHIVQGGELNIDERMHRRVAEVINAQLTSDDCLAFDCNGNSIPDSIDIANLTSADVNGDGIPDECQDCNGNSILDPLDIMLGMPDLNVNGVLDICEPDCNGNSQPDQLDIAMNISQDMDGNFIPDECDLQCSGPTPDHELLGDSLANDLDRNRIPDNCASEDCNGNGIPDWKDLQRENFLYAAYPGYGNILEFHEHSGVRTGVLPHSLADIAAMTITPNRRVLLLDKNGQTALINPSGGSNSYAAIPKGTDLTVVGSRVVASDTTAGGRLLLLDAITGVTIHSLPVLVSGLPQRPMAICTSPVGTVYTVTAERTILEFSVTSSTISPLGVRVPSSQAGPLSNPTAILVLSPSTILVGSGGTGEILEYNGVSGLYVGNYLSLGSSVPGISDLEMGPNGFVYYARTVSDRIIFIDPALKRPIGTFVRGLLSPLLTATSEMAFMPQSDAADCNQNGRLDACDIAAGSSFDTNHDGVPDECTITSCCIGSTGDVDCNLSVDIGDVTVLVDHLFISFVPLCCDGEADVDNSASIDIGDLTLLVDHLFISFGPLPSCL